MRRTPSIAVFFGIACLSGCTFADFWSSVANVANGGGGYRADHSLNRDRDFEARYEEQARLAREYEHRQPH
jgi:hypothetical protein